MATQTTMFPALCFGKLPSFGDFVRYNASSREALTLNEWVQQGMYFARTQLGTSWEKSFDAWTPNCFVFSPENAERFLVGAIQPSRDKGQRQYPFFVSALVDRRRFQEGGLHLVPMIFSDFFNDARQLMSRAMHVNGVPSMSEQIQSLHVQLVENLAGEAERYARYVRETTLENLYSRLFGSFEDGRKYLLMKNLHEILSPFRQRNLTRLTLGMRFPLSSERDDAALQVSFWMKLCLTILDVKSVTPTLFWGVSETAKQNYLFVFFHQPSPKNFLYLLRPDMNGDTMCMLDEEGSDKLALVTSLISQRLKLLLDSRGMTLKSFLDQVV